MSKILISACLVGNPVRYNGTDLLIEHPLIKKWQKEGRLVSICPEVAGGMSTPRAPSEIQGRDGYAVLSGEISVVNNQNKDVTDAFILGAQKALDLAINNHCKIAILTERSPSCGSHKIYDGSFSGTRVDGMGVTAALLAKNGIRVFNQEQLELIEELL